VVKTEKMHLRSLAEIMEVQGVLEDLVVEVGEGAEEIMKLEEMVEMVSLEVEQEGVTTMWQVVMEALEREPEVTALVLPEGHLVGLVTQVVEMVEMAHYKETQQEEGAEKEIPIQVLAVVEEQDFSLDLVVKEDYRRPVEIQAMVVQVEDKVMLLLKPMLEELVLVLLELPLKQLEEIVMEILNLFL
jgi:hypothetical protein